MKQPTLFDPPPRPLPQLSDEAIAVKVATWLKRWAQKNAGYDDDEEITADEVNVLAEAMMATGSRKWRVVLKWIQKNRPKSEWRWEDKAMLLEWMYTAACDAVLPDDGKSKVDVPGE